MALPNPKKTIRSSQSYLLLMLFDAGIAWISFQIAFYLRFSVMSVPHETLRTLEHAPYMHMALLAIPSRLFAGHIIGAYRKRPRPYRVSEDLPRLFASATIGTGILIVVAFWGLADWESLLNYRNFSFSRLVLTFDWLIALALLAVGHTSAGIIRNAIFSRGMGTRRLAIQGLGEEAHRIANLERTLAAAGYTVQGLIASGMDEEQVDRCDPRHPFLGDTDEIAKLINDYGLHDVIVTNVRGLGDKFLRFVEDCHQLGVTVHLAPDLAGLMYYGQPIEDVGGIPLMQINAVGLEGTQELTKRIEDLIVASIAVIALLPLMALIAIAIKATSKGPILFIQRRLGKNGRVINVYKFRSMVHDAEALRKNMDKDNESGGVLFKMKRDPRITPIGRIIRRASIDELPQLFNVLKGDMSLIGPRPLPVTDIASPDEWERKRFSAMPGITGLWQVNRTEHTTEEMLRWDLYYIEHWSLWLDLRILAKTLLVVLLGRGAY